MTHVTKLSINVEGMTCGHCAARVNEALASLPGVSNVAADHLNDKVEMDLALWVSPTAISAAVEHAGYHYKSASLHPSVWIPVNGMHCGNCAGKVKESLIELPGVAGVDVSLDEGGVTVTGTADLALLLHSIEVAGFAIGPQPWS